MRSSLHLRPTGLETQPRPQVGPQRLPWPPPVCSRRQGTSPPSLVRLCFLSPGPFLWHSPAPNAVPGPQHLQGTLRYHLLSPKQLPPLARTATCSFPPWHCSQPHDSGFPWFVDGLPPLPHRELREDRALTSPVLLCSPCPAHSKHLVRERVSGSSTPFSTAALHVPETACQLPPRPVTEGEGDSQRQPQAVTPGAARGPSLWGELGSDSASSPQGRKWGAPNSRCPE